MDRVSAKVDRQGVRATSIGGHGFDPVLGGARDPLSDGLSDPLRSVQLDAGGTQATDPSSVAAGGVSGASSTLPHLGAIQSAFGKHDVSGVRAQVGGPARTAADALGANAFATGDRVGFSKGPDLHTAAHEAAHVVQQENGVQLQGGVGRSGDVYERHADAVADQVVAGRSAEGLLDQHPGGGPQNQGVQRDVKRSSVEKAAMALEGPAFGVPGLKWSVKAEGEREVESEVMGGKPETTVKASLAGGLKYDLWLLELGVDLTADVEVKVEGNETTGEALHRGVKEFARWYAASRLGDVATQRARIETEFLKTRQDVLGAYRELGDLLTNSSFKDFKNGATSWFYMTQSPRAKVSTSIDLFHGAINSLFKVAKADGNAIQAAKAFVDKDALLNDFASAANTDERAARKSIDRSRGKFLNRFDPAKNQLLTAFDGLDAAKMLERDPQVSFVGTFGAALSAKGGWGGSGGGENDNELEVSVGAGKRIQSGGDQHFQLGTQDVLRGKMALKLGKWGVEVKGDRQLTGAEDEEQEVKWKLEVEGKREGLLDQEPAEEAIDALEVGVGGVARSGTLPDTCDIPTALERMQHAFQKPAEEAMVVKGEGGAEVSLGGEIEIEFKRADATQPWVRQKVAGKVAAGGFGGAKGSLGMTSKSKLGKIEGGVQKGYKLSKSFG